MEGYLNKPNSSDLRIILCSTPGAPNGLMQQIDLEKNSLYYKIRLSYHYGLEGPNPIYSKEQIEEAKIKSPEFSREMELAWLGKVGNVFSHQSIENCQKIPYDPDQFIPAKISIGLDPSFNAFGICATRLVNQKIEVIVAVIHNRPFESDIVDRVFQIKKKYGLITSIYVDAANPSMWQTRIC
jgi:hypothetical protein